MGASRAWPIHCWARIATIVRRRDRCKITNVYVKMLRNLYDEAYRVRRLLIKHISMLCVAQYIYYIDWCMVCLDACTPVKNETKEEWVKRKLVLVSKDSTWPKHKVEFRGLCCTMLILYSAPTGAAPLLRTFPCVVNTISTQRTSMMLHPFGWPPKFNCQ